MTDPEDVLTDVPSGTHSPNINTATHLTVMMLKILSEGTLSRLSADDCAHRARKLRDAIELAYGCLWLGVDSENPRRPPAGYADLCANTARQALLEHLDRAGQARGIEAARQELSGEDHD